MIGFDSVTHPVNMGLVKSNRILPILTQVTDDPRTGIRGKLRHLRNYNLADRTVQDLLKPKSLTGQEASVFL